MSNEPLYEFRCKTCDDTFEMRRSMAESNLALSYPAGHDNAVRLLSVLLIARTAWQFGDGRRDGAVIVAASFAAWPARAHRSSAGHRDRSPRMARGRSNPHGPVTSQSTSTNPHPSTIASS